MPTPVTQMSLYTGAPSPGQITTAQASIYHTPFYHTQWTSTGLRGLLVFSTDPASGSHSFRILSGPARKVVWTHTIPRGAGMAYDRDKPFFHVFAGASRRYGFRFDDDQEADAFYRTVVESLGAPKPPTNANKKKRAFLTVRLARVPLDEKACVATSEYVGSARGR
ncbi:hypothetical protein OE88DRAFT_1806996 [Heliocybe sulcata]|uniref:WH1 domain-containing protein n=1 Tax=Heliocybe sulcata TaxID=5364 RepID=A0A5C3N5Y3_9AGAM|nr:hypothetical protein OE88DRAFT_1806996 [Heliocybe sulcata]